MSGNVSLKDLIVYFLDQSHSNASYDQNMTISTLSYELLILLQTHLV